MTDIAKLADPFDPSRVKWRIGVKTGDGSKGLALCYIDARHVQDRLDEVCGPGGWQSTYADLAGGRTMCRIGIKCGDEWVWKGDGAGDTDVEKEKGSFSSAFKRAAVTWGIGRYLYDIKGPWVALEKSGRSHVIAKHEHARLAKILPGARIEGADDADPKDGPANNDADKPDPVAEWANKNWTADKLDVRQMGLPDEKLAGALKNMAAYAPTIQRLEELWALNAAYHGWLSANNEDAFASIKTAFANRKGFLSQQPAQAA